MWETGEDLNKFTLFPLLTSKGQEKMTKVTPEPFLATHQHTLAPLSGHYSPSGGPTLAFSRLASESRARRWNQSHALRKLSLIVTMSFEKEYTQAFRARESWV